MNDGRQVLRRMHMITLGFNPTEQKPRRSELDAFLRMCEQIGTFMQEQSGKHFNAYFSRDGDVIGLFVVTAAEVYDFELGDQLAEFAAPYIEHGLLNSVTLLPKSTPEELAAYFDPMTAVRVEMNHS
jgi:hypothetical protein